MKRVLLICITLILMFLNSCNTYNVQDSETQDFENFYNPQITESIYFERLSDTKHSIYISENDSAELVNRKYIVEDVLIFRYAYDDGFLVYHWNKLNPLNESTKNVRILNSIEYEITEDLFTVFDVSNNLECLFHLNDLKKYPKIQHLHHQVAILQTSIYLLDLFMEKQEESHILGKLL